jgi:hypothetical protein
MGKNTDFKNGWQILKSSITYFWNNVIFNTTELS